MSRVSPMEVCTGFDCVDRRHGYVDKYGVATGNHVNWWDWHVARYGNATGNLVKSAGELFSAICYQTVLGHPLPLACVIGEYSWRLVLVRGEVWWCWWSWLMGWLS